MTTRKPFVVGNWKMNGDIAANERLFAALRPALDASLLARVDVSVCPPFPYLGQAAAWLGDLAGSGDAGQGGKRGLSYGAQDVAAWAAGAYTGEVSGAMLADLGCRWALVGHSERRALLGETDATVAAKAERALEAGLGVIVCVGESLQERESGVTAEVVARQVGAVAALAARTDAARFVVAYEPVWAIGTGRTASPEQAQDVHAQIRALLRSAGAPADAIRLLYGGSVKPANASQLFGQADIDGGLIGGAALVADDFIAICRAAAGSA